MFLGGGIFSVKRIITWWKKCFYFIFIFWEISPKIRAKRVGVKKDKICIFTIQDTFLLSSICKECQGYQWKAFFIFVPKDRRWISNIRGEKFQRGGRKISIKQTMFLFDYITIVSSQIFKKLLLLPSYDPFKCISTKFAISNLSVIFICVSL